MQRNCSKWLYSLSGTLTRHPADTRRRTMSHDFVSTLKRLHVSAGQNHVLKTSPKDVLWIIVWIRPMEAS